MHRRSFLIGAVALMVSAQALPKPRERDEDMVFIDEWNDIWNSGFKHRFLWIDGRPVTDPPKPLNDISEFDPPAGPILYTYKAGTTTPRSMYYGADGIAYINLSAA